MSACRHTPHPARLHAIIARIEAGASHEEAARAARVPFRSLRAWLARGSPLGRHAAWKPHPTLTPFWHAVTRAVALAATRANNRARASALAASQAAALRDNPRLWLAQHAAHRDELASRPETRAIADALAG